MDTTKNDNQTEDPKTTTPQENSDTSVEKPEENASSSNEETKTEESVLSETPSGDTAPKTEESAKTESPTSSSEETKSEETTSSGDKPLEETKTEEVNLDDKPSEEHKPLENAGTTPPPPNVPSSGVTNGGGEGAPEAKKGKIPLPLAITIIILVTLLVAGALYTQTLMKPIGDAVQPTEAPEAMEVIEETVTEAPTPTLSVTDQIDEVDTGASDSSTMQEVEQDIQSL